MEKSSNEKINEIGNWFKKHIVDFVILFVALVYIVGGLFVMKPTGKTVLQIIGEGALFFFICIVISNMFMYKGLKSGHENIDVIDTVKDYEKLLTGLKPKIHKLPAWCARKNEEEIKEQQDKILIKFGLTSKHLTDEFLKQEHSEEIQSAISKCLNLKIYELNAEELTSEVKVTKNKFKLGLSQSDFIKRTTWSDIATKVASAIFVGYYTFDLVQSITWAKVFYPALQIAFVLIMGIFKFQRAENYVEHEYRNRFIKKMNFLNEFDNETFLDSSEVIEEKEYIKGEENGNITIQQDTNTEVDIEHESEQQYECID